MLRVGRFALCVAAVVCWPGLLACRPASEAVPLTVWAFTLPEGGWEFHVPVCGTSGLVLGFDLSDSHGAEVSARSTYVANRPARVVVLTVNAQTLAENSFNVDEVKVGRDDRTKGSPKIDELDVFVSTSQAAAEFRPKERSASDVAVYVGIRREPVQIISRSTADDHQLLKDACSTGE